MAPTDLTSVFGAELKRRRTALGLSRTTLADRAGCAVDTLRKIELGKRRPSEQLAERLAACLELDPAKRSAFLRAARGAAPYAEAPQQQALSTPVGATPQPGLPLSAFVGREAELATLAGWLGRGARRLLTLTGPPGVGKTRLSRHLAAEVAGNFSDGTVFVPLASLRDPRLVAAAIAHQLGLDQAGPALIEQQVALRLHERHLLLVLDNFEHVVAAAPLVASLLCEAPRLSVLVTSRTPLHLDGEQVYPLAPLSLPDFSQPLTLSSVRESAAALLFTLRAQALQPDFALSEANVEAVARICSRLDGLPLGIELAAARIAVFSPQALLERLDRRLHLLTSARRDAPEHQQTLRAALAWSYALLRPDEQVLFTRLGVFAGGATLPAIACVCAVDDGVALDAGAAPVGLAAHPLAAVRSPAIDLIAGLIDHSLLVAERSSDEARFGMLETMREFALEQLEACGESEALRDRHAAYFLALAEQAAQELFGPQQTWWLERLDQDHDNLRAALDWMFERRAGALLMRMGGALWRFWWLRSYLSEGRQWLEQIVTYHDCVAPLLQAPLFSGLGVIISAQGQPHVAQRYLAQCLTLYRDLADQRMIATALINLALIVIQTGDYAEAQRLLDETLALGRELQDSSTIARAIGSLGFMLQAQGRYGEARRCFEEGLRYFREQGLTAYAAVALGHLGLLALRDGDDRQAAAYIGEGLRIHQSQGHREGIINCLEGMARVSATRRQPLQTARLLGAAQSLRELVGVNLLSDEAVDYVPTLETIKEQLPRERWDLAWSEGRAMSTDEAISYAFTLLERQPALS